MVDLREFVDEYQEGSLSLTAKQIRDLKQIYDKLAKIDYEEIIPAFYVDGAAMACIRYEPVKTASLN
ncbi:hypothetical protein AWM79_21770 [Pseudomonas agarici]|uniref:Uncharacterized protein n=1 Tax=Pseudomonas agarici TaxID=46677 RepID=A0A0X1T6R1_PSEAA|nr:hypothetical protein AWM79_21770 [Pseudomonas agarici]